MAQILLHPRRVRATKVENRPRTALLTDAFEAWMTYLSNSGRSAVYEDQLRYFLGPTRKRSETWLPLVKYLVERDVKYVGDVNEGHLSAWMTLMREKTSDYCFAKSVNLMKRFQNFLVEQGAIPEPIIRVKTPKTPEAEIAIFSDAEIDALHRVLRTENVRDYAIFMLLCETGMRSGELCRLTLDDVRLDRAEIFIPGAITKTKSGRIVSLVDSLAPLRKYLQVRPTCDTQSLFLGFYSTPAYGGGQGKKSRATTGKLNFSLCPLTTSGLYQAIKKWGKLAGITEARCSAHTFRHWFAINYLRAGGDVFSLQKILGHSELDMTSKYAKMVETDLKERMQRFSPARRFTKDRYRKA